MNKIFPFLLLFLLFPTGCFSAEDKIIESPLPLKGWYSEDSKTLRTQLDGFLKKVNPGLKNQEIAALILPHAGYSFSGQVAAFGYGEISGKAYTRVIILGPSHDLYMKNFSALSGAHVIRTPLGTVSVDSDFNERLTSTGFFRVVPEIDSGEHSVHIQIPWLQSVLSNFKIVPIVIGDLDEVSMKESVKQLLSLLDEKTLVIASSDFTHYGPRFDYVPFREKLPENLKQLDMGAYDFIEKKDRQGFLDYCERTGITICGRAPITILLSMLLPEMRVRLLQYKTSGDLTGDFENSVSYLAAAVTGKWRKESGNQETQHILKEDLSTEDKEALLKLARKTLEYYLNKGVKPSPADLGIEISKGMQRIMGAFVTLTENRELRGCIGEIFPKRALYEAVMDHAIDSGVSDYRFSPVTISELPGLKFEISALTEPYSVQSYNEIVLGRHGIVIQKNGLSAVYLPQVASEQGWDLKTTLSELSLKAGLPSDAWKEGASFLVFEAIVFSEREIHSDNEMSGQKGKRGNSE